MNSYEQPRVLNVRIKDSKTDRLRRGATVTIGCTGKSLCPVNAILRFMIVRKVGPGPFFIDKAGIGLIRKIFVREVKGALNRADLDSRAISGHSFRIGAATAAAQCGASDAEIKKLGRWKSREYKGYVRSGSQGLGELPRKLAEANQEADQCS